METPVSFKPYFSNFRVLSLPTRDGNNKGRWNAEGVDEVLSLPTRDGNRKNDWGDEEKKWRFKPTYKGWKRLHSGNNPLILLSF